MPSECEASGWGDSVSPHLAGQLAGLLYPTGELSFFELVGFKRSLVSSESGRGQRSLAPTCSVPRRRE